jgi:hypothetical protein
MVELARIDGELEDVSDEEEERDEHETPYESKHEHLLKEICVLIPHLLKHDLVSHKWVSLFYYPK